MVYENIDSFNPEDCVSSKVMRLNRLTANLFRKYLKSFGITDSQLALLFILCKNDNLNQSQLSKISVLEKSSLSRNLNRLLEAGLITKDNFPIISISDKGRQLVEDIIPEWRKAMEEIEHLLEDDGKKALDVIMGKMLKK